MSPEDDLAIARAMVGSFTPERPMIVGPEVMKDMIEHGGFADLMDRVKLVETIPHEEEPCPTP